MAQPLPGQRIADCLKLELGLAAVFWLPYALPSTDVFDRPYLGMAWLGLWAACPLLTLLGLLTLPRDWELRWGWPQILLAAILASSIWWRFAKVELF
jgi:hypothetical protein